MRRLSPAAALVATLTLATGLAGCGFEPLYATRSVSPSLSHIEVTPPKGRVGFLLAQQLDDQLARDRSQAARYRMLISLRQTRYARGVRVNSVANRYELILTVGYTLSDAATGRTLTSGVTPLEVSYDSADPPYAGVTAEQNAEERAAGQAAVLLRLELSRYFAGLPGR